MRPAPSVAGVETRFAGAALLNTHRGLVALVSILLFAPTILFATSLRAPAAALVIVGALGGLALILRRGQAEDASFLDEAIDFRLLAALIAGSAVLLVLGGALHLVYAPFDWRTRDAVLADVARNWLPLVYLGEGGEYVLRAPLGMYMLPGLVGRALGLSAAHVALWMQDSLLLGAILYLFACIGRGWPHALVLLGFAGCALLGAAIFEAISGRDPFRQMLVSGVDTWNPYFQYSGSLVQIVWVPNHALPGWWLAALMLLQARRQVDLATLGATIGAAMFWSPLAILPAFAWIAFRALASPRESLGSRRLWLLAALAPCFLPVALYMIVGAGTIEHGMAAAKPLFFVLYAVFLIAQFAPAAYVLAFRERLPGDLRAPLVFSLVVLAALPLFSFGPSNDLVMRGSIPALVVLAFCFGEVLLAPGPRSRAFWIGLIVLAACLPSALYELARPLLRARYDISDCSLFEANAAMGIKGVSPNYVAERSTLPGWLFDLDRAPRATMRAKRCWSDGGEPGWPGVSG